MSYVNLKDVSKEIKETIHQIKGVKLSVTSTHNKICVSLVEAPFKAFTFACNDNYKQVNPYHFSKDNVLTSETKTVFSLVDEIIKKYHYDRSDAMTDYFDTNFYYDYNVGKWNKEFKQIK